MKSSPPFVCFVALLFPALALAASGTRAGSATMKMDPAEEEKKRHLAPSIMSQYEPTGSLQERIIALEQLLAAIEVKMDTNDQALHDKIDANYADHQSQIDALDAKLDDNVTSLHEKVDTNYGDLQDQIDALDTKVDSNITTLLVKVDANYAELQSQIDALEAKVDANVTTLHEKVDANYDDHQSQLDTLEANLGNLESQVGHLECQITANWINFEDYRDRTTSYFQNLVKSTNRALGYEAKVINEGVENVRSSVNIGFSRFNALINSSLSTVVFATNAAFTAVWNLSRTSFDWLREQANQALKYPVDTLNHILEFFFDLLKHTFNFAISVTNTMGELVFYIINAIVYFVIDIAESLWGEVYQTTKGATDTVIDWLNENIIKRMNDDILPIVETAINKFQNGVKSAFNLYNTAVQKILGFKVDLDEGLSIKQGSVWTDCTLVWNVFTQKYDKICGAVGDIPRSDITLNILQFSLPTLGSVTGLTYNSVRIDTDANWLKKPTFQRIPTIPKTIEGLYLPEKYQVIIIPFSIFPLKWAKIGDISFGETPQVKPLEIPKLPDIDLKQILLKHEDFVVEAVHIDRIPRIKPPPKVSIHSS